MSGPKVTKADSGLKTSYADRRGILIVPIVLGLALVLISPGVPIMPASGAETAMTTLKIGMLEPIDSLNPFIGINDNAYVFYGLVYDFLIAVDEDLKPKPNLAESWNVVKDELPVGSVWQYNLTRDAKWHDGEPFTADDVKFTMDYQTGVNWGTMWAYQPYTLMINYTEIIDDYTVRIHFRHPITKEPNAIAFGESLMIPIVPKHFWETISAADAGFGYANPFPIGTGPFKCTKRTYDEFLTGQRLILYKNPDYHLGAVKFDRLVLEFYLEPAAMVVDMQRGALDLAAFATPNFKNLMDWLESNPTDSIGTYSGLSCTSYSVEIDICQAQEPGTNNWLRRDPAVRQAMAYATNKTFIRDHIYMGYADIGYSLFSKVYGDYYWEPAPGEEYEFNITKANEILDNAGYYWNGDHTMRLASWDNPYKSITNELKFDIYVETELFEDRATVQFLQSQWAQIGVRINPIYVDTATWNSIVYNSMGAFDMAATYWSGDPDPNYLLYTQSTWALTGWSENYYSSKYYDENYTQSIVLVNKSERLPYVHNCLKHIYYDAAFIVNVYPYGCWAWRTDHFTGWGDWEAHPGRQLSNFWTSNDLFFDLEPVTVNLPPTAILDPAGGRVGEAVLITGCAWDPDGDEMNYTIEFGDGQNESGEVPVGSELVFEHAYSSAGVYTANLSVFDEKAGEVVRAAVHVMPPGVNVPPSNVRLLPEPMEGFTLLKEANFKASARDDDGDTLNLNLSFGDDSISYDEDVTGTEELFSRTVAHEYARIGTYALLLNVSDGVNYTTVSLSIIVEEEQKSSDLGLYIGLAVAVAVIAVVIAVLMMKRKPGARIRKEEEDVRLP